MDKRVAAVMFWLWIAVVALCLRVGLPVWAWFVMAFFGVVVFSALNDSK